MNQSRSVIPVLGIMLSVGVVIALAWAAYRTAGMEISGEGFFIQWTGIHSLVKDGTSPYSEQVGRQIREVVPFQSSFSGGVAGRYTSPLYSGITVLPFALISNPIIARTLWLSLQLIAIFAIIMIVARMTDWKPTWYTFILFVLFTTLSYHVAIPWLDGGLSIWATFFLCLCFLSIRNKWNEVGGVFLALSAIQPQMSILVIIFTVVWSWTMKKRVLVVWFFMTLILLSVFGVFLVPNWPRQYIGLLYNLREVYPAGSLGALFIELWPGLGKQLGWMATILLTLGFLLESRLALKKGFRHFFWTACLTLVITQWIGIPMTPGNFVGLLLPLILVAAKLSERWPRGGQWSVLILALSLFAWEWGLVYTNLTGSQPSMHLNLLIPLPFVLLLGLFWVRWSAIRPERRLLEELRSAQG